MSGIIICSQCGTQAESHKKFCPNCGAALTPHSSSHAHPQAARSSGSNAQASVPSSGAAGSALFTALQQKKQDPSANGNGDVKTEGSSTSVVTVEKKTERPKTFAKKPLGVAKPEAPTSKVKHAEISQEERAQLIEFLRGLNRLDRFLEASAVVKKDGSLLASAHSTRAKPEMMTTITSTLFSISEDSIRAISGGKIRSVTVMAETCVLMLCPINEDTILLLVTSPKSNLGLLSMQSEVVSQNIAKLLATFS